MNCATYLMRQRPDGIGRHGRVEAQCLLAHLHVRPQPQQLLHQSAAAGNRCQVERRDAALADSMYIGGRLQQQLPGGQHRTVSLLDLEAATIGSIAVFIR